MSGSSSSLAAHHHKTSGAMTAKDYDNEWWRNALIYQIYPRSFMDSNGDGIGDLRGILMQLNHLADIAVDAIWLSPIFASPMVDFGYDVSDFKSIHPDYGTMADFDELLQKANKLGIKVLLDFVPNHTSDQCEWFEKSVRREPGFEEFYMWSDGRMNKMGVREPPNNWVSNFYGSAWTWNEKRQQYYLHQFAKEQPDLNYRNPAVLAAMDDVLLFWLEKGVSGFRIDAFNHVFEDPSLKDEPLSGKTLDKKSYDFTEHIYTKDLPELHGLILRWRRLLDNYSEKHGGPARIMMTEAYADTKKLMDYYETPPAGEPGVHFPFNFIMITDLNADSDARDFVFKLQKWLIYMPHGHVANWVMGNHDVPRAATRFGVALTDAMNMLLLTLPGVAVTYNGEEIGMLSNDDLSWSDTVDPFAINVGEKDYKKVSRDPSRTPFQWSGAKNSGFSTAARTWLPVHKNYVDLNLAAQREAAKSHYKVYKALAELRQSPILRTGETELLVVQRTVFLLKRKLKGHGTLLTVINLGNEVQKVDLRRYAMDGNSYEKLRVLISSSNSSYENGSAYLSAFGSAIFEANSTLRSRLTMEEKRLIMKTTIKSLNIILIGLLMYKLWNNKWSSLKFYDDKKSAPFTNGRLAWKQRGR